MAIRVTAPAVCGLAILAEPLYLFRHEHHARNGMSDRLSLAHTIEETAGLERAKAEWLASAIFETIHEGVAT